MPIRSSARGDDATARAALRAPASSLPSGILTRDDLHARAIPVDRLSRTGVRRITHGVHRRVDDVPGSWGALGYSTPPAPLPPEETAAVVRAGRGVASHLTALLLHRIPVPPWLAEDGRIHLTRPHARGVCRRFGVLSHARSLGEEDVVRLHGIPVTTVERTWADLASLLPRGMVDPLVVAGDAVVTPPWTSEGRGAAATSTRRLRAALDRAGRFKGVVAAREALELVRVGADSPQETALRLALHHAGLPEPELQLRLHPDRERTPDADLGWREWRLVLHYDGGTHLDPAQAAQDAQWRDEGWRRAGWAQIWATVEDARDDFRRVTDEVAAHRARLGGWRYAVE